MKKIFIIISFLFITYACTSSSAQQLDTQNKVINKNIDSLKIKRDSTQNKRMALYKQLEQNSKSLQKQNRKIDSLINRKKK